MVGPWMPSQCIRRKEANMTKCTFSDFPKMTSYVETSVHCTHPSHPSRNKLVFMNILLCNVQVWFVNFYTNKSKFKV